MSSSIGAPRDVLVAAMQVGDCPICFTDSKELYPWHRIENLYVPEKHGPLIEQDGRKGFFEEIEEVASTCSSVGAAANAEGIKKKVFQEVHSPSEKPPHFFTYQHKACADCITKMVVSLRRATYGSVLSCPNCKQPINVKNIIGIISTVEGPKASDDRSSKWSFSKLIGTEFADGCNS